MSNEQPIPRSKSQVRRFAAQRPTRLELYVALCTSCGDLLTSDEYVEHRNADNVEIYTKCLRCGCDTEQIHVLPWYVCRMSAYDELKQRLADAEEIMQDQHRLTRELDIALCGKGAAPQASLCDLIPFAESLRDKLTAAEQRNRELEVEAACKDTILANNIQGMSNRDVRIVELEAEVAELKGVCDAD